MTTWARHFLARTWCYVLDRGASVVTGCNGRWPSTDDYETSASPAHEDRCEACQAVAIDRQRINRGLCEIREATAADVAELRGRGL